MSSISEERFPRLGRLQKHFAHFEKLLARVHDPVDVGQMTAQQRLLGTLLLRAVNDGEISFAQLDPAGQRDGKEIEGIIRGYMRDVQLVEARRAFRDAAHGRRTHNGVQIFNAATQLGRVGSALKDAQKHDPYQRIAYPQLELTAGDLRAMHDSIQKLGHDELQRQANNDWRQEGVVEYDRFMASLPKFPNPPKKPIFGAPPAFDFTEALFTAGESGYAPLDNPRNWQEPDVCRKLLQQMKDVPSLMQRRTDRGSTVFDVAMHRLPAKEIVQDLNRRGKLLRADVLLDEQGKPSRLLQRFMAKEDGIAGLFIESNWLGDPNGLRQVYHALPEDKRPQNYHQLLRQSSAGVPAKGVGR